MTKAGYFWTMCFLLLQQHVGFVVGTQGFLLGPEEGDIHVFIYLFIHLFITTVVCEMETKWKMRIYVRLIE